MRAPAEPAKDLLVHEIAAKAGLSLAPAAAEAATTYLGARCATLVARGEVEATARRRVVASLAELFGRLSADWPLLAPPSGAPRRVLVGARFGVGDHHAGRAVARLELDGAGTWYAKPRDASPEVAFAALVSFVADQAGEELAVARTVACAEHCYQPAIEGVPSVEPADRRQLARRLGMLARVASWLDATDLGAENVVLHGAQATVVDAEAIGAPGRSPGLAGSVARVAGIGLFSLPVRAGAGLPVLDLGIAAPSAAPFLASYAEEIRAGFRLAHRVAAARCAEAAELAEHVLAGVRARCIVRDTVLYDAVLSKRPAGGRDGATARRVLVEQLRRLPAKLALGEAVVEAEAAALLAGDHPRLGLELATGALCDEAGRPLARLAPVVPVVTARLLALDPAPLGGEEDALLASLFAAAPETLVAAPARRRRPPPRRALAQVAVELAESLAGDLDPERRPAALSVDPDTAAFLLGPLPDDFLSGRAGIAAVLESAGATGPAPHRQAPGGGGPAGALGAGPSSARAPGAIVLDRHGGFLRAMAPPIVVRGVSQSSPEALRVALADELAPGALEAAVRSPWGPGRELSALAAAAGALGVPIPWQPSRASALASCATSLGLIGLADLCASSAAGGVDGFVEVAEALAGELCRRRSATGRCFGEQLAPDSLRRSALWGSAAFCHALLRALDPTVPSLRAIPR
ncbi:MAG: DUF4135 domain-containing protein [Actinomycetota bacterium]|nr:DUF4135 domain-containing protein [Actinomycetota bacterium]